MYIEKFLCDRKIEILKKKFVTRPKPSYSLLQSAESVARYHARAHGEILQPCHIIPVPTCPITRTPCRILQEEKHPVMVAMYPPHYQYTHMRTTYFVHIHGPPIVSSKYRNPKISQNFTTICCIL